MAQRPRIAAAPQCIQMAQATKLQQAPRIAATPRQRGRKWMGRRERWLMANPLCIDCTAGGRTGNPPVPHAQKKSPIQKEIKWPESKDAAAVPAPAPADRRKSLWSWS